MTSNNGQVSSDSVNLGSNPSPPATTNTDKTGVSGDLAPSSQSEPAEQTAHTGRTKVGTGRPLGKNQLERLLGLASPCSLLVVGDGPVIASLVKRGLLKPMRENQKAWLQITPAGLRALADAHEAGQLERFMKWPWDRPGASS